MECKRLLELDLTCRCRRRCMLGHYVHKNVATLVHFSASINALLRQIHREGLNYDKNITLKPNNFQLLKDLGRRHAVCIRGHKKHVAAVRFIENTFKVGFKFRRSGGGGRRFGQRKASKGSMEMRAAESVFAYVAVNNELDLGVLAGKPGQ